MQNCEIDAQKLEAEIELAGQEILKRVKQIQISQKWIENGSQPCIQHRMDIEQRVASRGIHICDFHIEKVVEFLKKQESLRKINPQLKQIKVLYKKETPSIHYKVHYMEFSGVWPVANRDFVNLAIGFEESQSKVYIGTKSFDYPYPQNAKIVRGQVFLGAYIIQKIDQTHTKVTYISDADLKGSIPNFFKNALSQFQAQIAFKVGEIMEKENY